MPGDSDQFEHFYLFFYRKVIFLFIGNYSKPFSNFFLFNIKAKAVLLHIKQNYQNKLSKKNKRWRIFMFDRSVNLM